MAIFGRKRKDDEYDGEPELDGEQTEPTDHADADPADDADWEPTAPPRPTGPWDVDDLPADDTRDRVDLGALRLPVPDGVELRVDLDPNGGVMAATLVRGDEIMQLGVFAAPRTEPLWDEVREEIATSLAEGGGGSSVIEGEWGTELLGRVPTDTPGAFAAARFIGVNGPRWFLRALASGPGVAAGTLDPLLAETLRGVVVVRGADAMPPRDPLPLRLPKEAQANAEEAIAAQQAEAAVAAEAERRTLPPLAERGPETTETA